MNINWYPSHMHKTRSIIQTNLKLVDLVYEVLDARIPYSSKNPEIERILNNKKRIVILSKKDMANDLITKEWIKWYEEKGIATVSVDALKGSGIKGLMDETKKKMSYRIKTNDSKGIRGNNIKVMIIGLPNVGKSSLINSITASSKAKTGNKPGVTRGKQWINTQQNLMFLDTPGILWPNLSDKLVLINLGITGVIKDDVVDIIESALELLDVLLENHFDQLMLRYNLQDQNNNAHEVLEFIGKFKGCLSLGGKVDLERTAKLIINDFRKNKLGKISLETPERV